MKLEKPDLKSKKSKSVPTKPRHPNYGGARSGAGRPAFEPTQAERKQVEALSGYGLPFAQIAVLVRDGISLDTLSEHFAAELACGKAKANAKIGQTLFQKATGGDTTAMIWWSKTQMRWSERIELTGADGGAIKTENANTVVLEPSEAYKRLIGGAA
jgi:hypothetical protein